MNQNIYLIPMVAGSFAALVGSITAAFFQYRATRRAAGGSVNSSDARLVFEQLNSLILRLREEVEGLKRENRELRVEIAELREHLENGYCSKAECDLRLSTLHSRGA